MHKKPIELWIKLWGIGMVLQGFSTLLIQVPWESFLMIVGYGAALIWGRRVYGMRRIGLWFSGFLLLSMGVWLFINTELEPDRFRQIYFGISALFYIGLFTFLLMPEVEEAYGPGPVPKPLPVLTQEEERRIKFWVRAIAVVMVLEGVVSSTFSDWFQSHGMLPEGRLGAAVGVIAALGLLFFRQNIGRRFALFVYLHGVGG